ncbi:hypothetical protein CISIN_1g034640mg [Citrus sinensis]|uniref:Uncharacterized protein n=1 Tax=Citrus sinensis TaxID=2711 RepID=A0A067DLR9_CITSI|nr:hypothetical protein CISIN_1g034640mg [Citrus sinensis]
MSYIVLQNIHHVAPPKAPKTLFRSVLFALITTVLEYALLIALRSLNFLAGKVSPYFINSIFDCHKSTKLKGLWLDYLNSPWQLLLLSL